MLFRPKRRTTREYTTVATEYGHVMLDQARGRYWHLNESALIITGCLHGGGTRQEAADALVEAYGIEPERAMADVELACGRLQEVGVL